MERKPCPWEETEETEMELEISRTTRKPYADDQILEEEKMNQMNLQALQDQILTGLREDPSWVEDCNRLLTDLELDNLDSEGSYGAIWDVLQLGIVTAALAASERINK